MTLLRHKLFFAGFLLAMVVVGGSLGYYLLALLNFRHPYWPLADCLYMTFITLTTVGFGEIIDVANVPGARFFTIIILLSGLGISAYFVSTLTAFLVEGELQNVFWRKRMKELIGKLSGHIIICGVDNVGGNVLAELLERKIALVVIDHDEKLIIRLQDKHGVFPAIVGDPIQDSCLREAGITEAAGVITTLGDDKDNLCVVVTCKALNPSLRLISRCNSIDFAGKLELLGAEVVVPSYIGGLRMASQMIRPRVVRYLDTMLRERECVMRIEEVRVPDDSLLVGLRLSGLNLQELGNLLLLAVVVGKNSQTLYNPNPDYLINSGDTMVFQAEADGLRRFKERYRSA
ncbi:MAG: potassium transporter TrkA [Desulfobulbaceae bacterium]|nr:potassium transporter TrkA [Desulfobulbaceae bacterium]